MTTTDRTDRHDLGDLSWEAPGPGSWDWAGSHLPGVPTPIYAALHQATTAAGTARCFERYGVPLKEMQERFVNGRAYATLAPLLGSGGRAAPPKPVLWLASRLHPELRRRTRTAAAAMERRIWRTRTEEWHATLRPQLRSANLAFQAEDLGALDDEGLADHVRRVHDHVVAGHELHFDLHGDDMGPLGQWLATCRDWGIAPGEAIAALAGHSPSTMAAVDCLRKVAVAIEAEAAGAPEPTTLDELRALGPGVASALDEYLEEFGWRTLTGYDLDALTVGELPDVLVANVRSLPADDHGALAAQGDAAAAALRARVPAADQARFDEVLHEARTALDLRDDNGPMTIEWPVGLLRRALLEVGRRMVERGQLHEPAHAIELELDEVLAVLAGATGPGAEEVADRAAARAALAAVVPPAVLGAEPAPPDLSAFPKPLASVVDMAMTCFEHLEKRRPAATEAATAGGAADATGLGVGAEPYRGTARVARTPEEALGALEPGEVLVVPFTTPAYNAVLAMAGALVTEEGGALSHAAVLARELQLPSVIGLPGALSSVADGAEVEVDPTAGTVRVLTPR
jgi:pyruvate,water dikinase